MILNFLLWGSLAKMVAKIETDSLNIKRVQKPRIWNLNFIKDLTLKKKRKCSQVYLRSYWFSLESLVALLASAIENLRNRSMSGEINLILLVKKIKNIKKYHQITLLTIMRKIMLIHSKLKNNLIKSKKRFDIIK